ncbi:hypothetical protein TorRG33x02_141580 [Trema orientale]|uniref:Uncharacterized protein n=1 Tax=Trema orientale TaxID=63057 RepID=A0A2P5EX66_TREOI|nr:hypothetical protein TorRG33x02_141580 [Trema orientale]
MEANLSSFTSPGLKTATIKFYSLSSGFLWQANQAPLSSSFYEKDYKCMPFIIKIPKQLSMEEYPRNTPCIYC